MLLKLVSTVVPVYLVMEVQSNQRNALNHRESRMRQCSATHLRNSMSDRLVKTMLVLSQSSMPAGIEQINYEWHDQRTFWMRVRA